MQPVPRAAAAVPPSAAVLADLGRRAFFDPSLSASGRQSCASCHSPAHAYGPPNALAVQLGGPELQTPGTRAVPSLRYLLKRTPVWSHTVVTNPLERLADTDHVPSGGLAWDGRFNSVAEQVRAPLLAANEMANGSVEAVAAKLARAAYAEDFRRAFGAEAMARPEVAVSALAAALQQFLFDDPSLQPYSSRFDLWLDGRAQLTAREQRGLRLFKDPAAGNCASCHLVERGANGAHPLLTDFNFEALAVPRNGEIPANRDPRYFDLGLCGPLREDAARNNGKYCGLFKTPSLRNVATRGAFFHNGRFHRLEEALQFYVERDTQPQKWYAAGRPDDLPLAFHGNVDRIHEPLTRKRGDPPVWNRRDVEDVVAFLQTLTDADAASVR
nr:cytochrome c peroxidase [Pelomonas sp. KK5]